MVPNQQDVLSDYLSDMFGTPKSSKPAEDDSMDHTEEAVELNHSETQGSVTDSFPDSEITLEKEKISLNDNADVKDALDVEETTEYLDTFLSEVASQSSPQLSSASDEETKPIEVVLAVKEALNGVVLPPGLSDELNKLSHHIDDHKQLACLFDLVNKPVSSLTQGEKSLVVMELLDLMKSVPESRLKDYIRGQFEAVAG